ncbi:glycosyltransferase family 31 protein [Cercospora zeae-maydis SCOH1-5]|uniref:Glycosyltransferase family 31 protein n=1 Tax=Cercospora zeae-maydis SCOH1-5 TaxID=717836 RepID=A0A6A6FRW7_9PEZI|nr:glycosyltransferase family 31 protein [Cercospora zeae-maydis SCOH1-5]
MAYGGGGIFFSGPLLDVLHENYDACIKNGYGGDELYKYCIYTHTSPPVQLTLLPGLHQLDFHMDASGWYEAIQRPLLSLHHYNTWHLYPVEYGHLVADVCGADCFLQRYQFSDDVVLTNGYSVVKYPAGTDHLDLARVEGTFNHDEDQFLFSLGALRPKLSAAEKISWRLEHAQKTSSGAVRQFYIRRKCHNVTDHERLKAEVESVLELQWIP